MKENDNKWYVYAHKRLDKNEIFYVGIGCKPNFYRAYEKNKRNKIWYKIVKKTDYNIEIIYKDIHKEMASIKEMELIEIYGRIDLKTGTLCNMTNGGDGTKNKIVSFETKNKISNRLIGNKNYLYRTNFKTKNIYTYNLEGCFLKKYDSLNSCIKELNFKHNRIMEARKRNGHYKGYRFFEEYQGEKIKEINRLNYITKKVLLVNENKTFDSIKKAAEYIKVSPPAVRNSIINNTLCKNLKFEFLD